MEAYLCYRTAGLSLDACGTKALWYDKTNDGPIEHGDAYDPGLG